MIIFDDPRYAIIFGIVLFVLFFIIQLFLCFKVKSKNVKRIPVRISLFCVSLCVLLYLGVFGTSSGGLANTHQIGAIILLFVTGPPLVGSLLAWFVYKIWEKRGKV